LVRVGRSEWYDTQVVPSLAAPFESKRRTFLTVPTLDSLVVHDNALTVQENMQPGVASKSQ